MCEWKEIQVFTRQHWIYARQSSTSEFAAHRSGAFDDPGVFASPVHFCKMSSHVNECARRFVFLMRLADAGEPFAKWLDAIERTFRRFFATSISYHEHSQGRSAQNDNESDGCAVERHLCDNLIWSFKLSRRQEDNKNSKNFDTVRFSSAQHHNYNMDGSSSNFLVLDRQGNPIGFNVLSTDQCAVSLFFHVLAVPWLDKIHVVFRLKAVVVFPSGFQQVGVNLVSVKRDKQEVLLKESPKEGIANIACHAVWHSGARTIIASMLEVDDLLRLRLTHRDFHPFVRRFCSPRDVARMRVLTCLEDLGLSGLCAVLQQAQAIISGSWLLSRLAATDRHWMPSDIDIFVPITEKATALLKQRDWQCPVDQFFRRMLLSDKQKHAFTDADWLYLHVENLVGHRYYTLPNNLRIDVIYGTVHGRRSVEKFDLDFLKNTFDGERVHMLDWSALAQKKSLYKPRTSSSNGDDSIVKLLTGHAAERAKKYTRRGYTIIPQHLRCCMPDTCTSQNVVSQPSV